MPSLHWIGKDRIVGHHLEVPYRVLEKRYSFGAAPDSGENKIIHGDNLEALKALLPEYEGRVDCVYIDPPYNTGNEGWVYDDNMNDPWFERWRKSNGGLVGKEGEDLSRHDKWLCMMYPRLVLLRRLLSERGCIIVSIDENEHHTLKLLMDEVFGYQHYLGSICWKSRNTDNRVKTNLSIDHEFLVVYGNGSLTGRAIDRSDFKNLDEDERGPYVTDPLTGKAAQAERPNLHYVITNPKTGDVYEPDPSRGWITDRAGFDLLMTQKKIYWPKDPSSGKPRKKRFLFETEKRMPVSSFWTDIKGQTGADELDRIMGKRVFSFPKATDFMVKVLDIATKPDSIILDSFAGSGTTAHAVLKLNAEDGGRRRFILVEREDYAEGLTAERVRRASAGYGEGDRAVAGLGSGFSFHELGSELFDEEGFAESAPEAARRSFVWWAETGRPLDGPAAAAPGPLLGTRGGIAYYLFEGSFGPASLGSLRQGAESHVVYAPLCSLGPAFLESRRVVFKKIPRDLPIEGKAPWS